MIFLIQVKNRHKYFFAHFHVPFFIFCNYSIYYTFQLIASWNKIKTYLLGLFMYGNHTNTWILFKAKFHLIFPSPWERVKYHSILLDIQRFLSSLTQTKMLTLCCCNLIKQLKLFRYVFLPTLSLHLTKLLRNNTPL